MSSEMDLSGALLQEFNEVVSDAETMAFPTRDLGLQRQSLLEMRGFLQKLESEKLRCVQGLREDSANACLALQCIVEALIAEIEMWLSLRENEPERAWDFFVKAERAAGAAIRAHPLGAMAQARLFLYQAIEQIVFPPQVFMSSGFVVREQHCSICEKDYEQCDHIKGRPYMGEFCHLVVTRADLHEVSVVPQPADKCCRVVRFGWRRVAKSDDLAA